MKICYFGTYRKNYSRNKIMIASLRAAGAEVIECHVPLWTGIEDRVIVTSGGWRNPRFWLRVIKTYRELQRKIKQIGTFDVLMLGYPGQFDVFIAKRLACHRRVPLVLDIFMSPYLVAIERKLHEKPGSFVKALHFIEKLAYKIPDLMFQDTKQYKNWLVHEFGILADKIALIPTSADETMFFPIPNLRENNKRFEVLYYGTFIPNHGLDKLLDAVRLLKKNPSIHFTFVGSGPLLPMVEEYIHKHKLTNLSLSGWLPQDELNILINTVDLCLGAFGGTPQSLMTIQNKIYECMAAGAAVLTGNSQAIDDSFTSGIDMFSCERTASGISNAISTLSNQTLLLDQVRKQAYKTFQDQYAFRILGNQLLGFLTKFIEQNQE
jgi:glycosyltransferase involved in cell wall biosynthesis